MSRINQKYVNKVCEPSTNNFNGKYGVRDHVSFISISNKIMNIVM